MGLKTWKEIYVFLHTRKWSPILHGLMQSHFVDE